MFRKLCELFRTFLGNFFRDVWQCISSRLDNTAEGLKPERIQEPAAPDDPETVSEGNRKKG